jgi:4-amino-4-deoxy-L-arabinose transferase-like glycosyltransferase
MQFQFNKHTYLLILVLAIGTLIIVPGLLMEGMFMDGQQYACVAKNYAKGKGTFWFPFLSGTWCMAPMHRFMEHPPLFYFLQSFAFRLFGDSMYAERIFSLLMVVLNGSLICAIWNLVTNKEVAKFTWLPLFFFFGIPIVAWVFQNNMIEQTLSVFTLLSVYFVLLAFKRKERAWLFFICSGAFVFLATFIKGVPGLFPIVAPLIYYFVFKKPSLLKSALGSVIIAAVPAFVYLLIMKLSPEGNESLTYYVKERLLNRIQNSPSTDSRFFILGGLIQELIPLLLFSVFTWYINKKKIGENLFKSGSAKWALFFVGIGLSGSLPLMLTLVQNKFYFFPALPFIAIGGSFFVLPVIKKIMEVFDYKPLFVKRLKIVSFLAAGISIILCVASIGDFKRDEKVIEDVRSIISVVGSDNVLKVERGVYDEWSFQFYLLRFGDIAIEATDRQHPFYISFKNSKNPVPENYKRIGNELNGFILYALKK